MKLPRDVSSRDLAHALERFGYTITHQTGSHMRLTTKRNGEHHISIPDHNPLRVGTLSGLLRDVGAHHKQTRDELIGTLFG